MAVPIAIGRLVSKIAVRSNLLRQFEPRRRNDNELMSRTECSE